MKVTLITVCRNAAGVIGASLDSVFAQTHTDIEVVVIDGASTDGTQEVVEQYRDRLAHYVSEPDKGIYDAMNKGLRAASGEVIGFVNAGDLLMTPKVIAQVVEAFQRAHVDAVYGDIIMVDEHDIHKVHRTWLSSTYHRANFRKGWMPPHVGTFIRKSAYDRFGHFNTDLRIAADLVFVEHA